MSQSASHNIDWSRVRNVLLIRLRSIGDTVLMTPCLDALKKRQPAARISVVIEPLAEEILEGNPLVDRLFVAGKSLASRVRLIAALRREHFDLAFNLHGGSTGMLIAAMSGAGCTVGFRDQRGSWLLDERAPAPDVILGREIIHSVEQQLSLLHWADVPMPEQPRLILEINPDAVTRARAKLISAGVTSPPLGSGRLAIVAPGAAFESKRWNARGFASVIDHLRSRWQLESVVIASPGQERLAREVAGYCGSTPPVLTGLTLGELTAVIGAFGRVFVGNDSGPMHIGAALGCPLVAVFGSSNPDVWHPWTEAPYRVLGGERDAGDSNVRGAIDRVAVEEVIGAIDAVLQSAATQAAS